MDDSASNSAGQDPPTGSSTIRHAPASVEEKFELPPAVPDCIPQNFYEIKYCHLEISDGSDPDKHKFAFDFANSHHSKGSLNNCDFDRGNASWPCLAFSVDLALDHSGNGDPSRMLDLDRGNNDNILRVSVDFTRRKGFLNGDIQYWSGGDLIHRVTEIQDYPDVLFREFAEYYRNHIIATQARHQDKNPNETLPKRGSGNFFRGGNVMRWKTLGPVFGNIDHSVVQQILSDENAAKEWSETTIRNLTFIKHLFDVTEDGKESLQLTFFWAFSPSFREDLRREFRHYETFVQEFIYLIKTWDVMVHGHTNAPGQSDSATSQGSSAKSTPAYARRVRMGPQCEFDSMEWYAHTMTRLASEQSEETFFSMNFFFQRHAQIWIVRIPRAMIHQSDTKPDETENPLPVTDQWSPSSDQDSFIVFVKVDEDLTQKRKFDEIPNCTRLDLHFLTEPHGPVDTKWTGIVVNPTLTGEMKTRNIHFCVLARRPVTGFRTKVYSRFEDAIREEPDGLMVRLESVWDAKHAGKIKISFDTLQIRWLTLLSKARLGLRRYAEPKPDYDGFSIRGIKGGINRNVNLTGVDPSVLSTWRSKLPEFCSGFESELGEDQLEFIDLLAQQQPINFLVGPPGSGRTLTAVATAIVTALSGRMTGQKAPVLVVTPTEAAVHVLFERITSVMPPSEKTNCPETRSIPQPKNVSFSQQTTRLSFQHLLAGNNFDAAVIKLGQFTDVAALHIIEEVTAMMEYDKTCLEEHLTSTAEFASNLVKECVSTYQNQDCSRLSDKLLDSHEKAELIQEICQKSKSKILITKDEINRWLAAYTHFRDLAFSRADILISTCENATDVDLISYFKPVSLLVDKSSQTPELSFATLLNRCHTLKQMNLFCDASLTGNSLWGIEDVINHELSLDLRLREAAFPVARLRTQYRMTENLCKLLESLNFGDSAALNTKVEENLSVQAMAVRKFIESVIFPLAENKDEKPDTFKEYAFVDIPGGVGYGTVSHGSLINLHEVHAIVFLVVELVKSGGCKSLENIAAVSFYKEQVQEMEAEFERRNEQLRNDTAWNECCRANGMNADLSQVKCRTIKSMQDCDSPIVFVSLAVTGRDYNHLPWCRQEFPELTKSSFDQHDLRVVVTRQKCGLIVVGNLAMIEQAVPDCELNDELLEGFEVLASIHGFFYRENHIFRLPESMFEGCDAGYQAKINFDWMSLDN